MNDSRTILEENFASLRLDEEQRKALRAAVEWLDCDVYVFGSRTNQSKRGGDTDVLVLSKESKFKLSLEIERRFFEICEDKLDVVVTDPDNMTDFAKFLFQNCKLVKIL